MTRRIPVALGIVVVFAALRSLYSITPMLAMAAHDDFDIPLFVWLLLGGAVAQMVTGIAIAVESRHARLALLTWTATALATVILARDELMTEATTAQVVVAYLEMLAGPALVWLVPLRAGDLPPVPALPMARVVTSSADVGSAPPPRVSRAARRYDVGVLLVGLGIVTMVGTIVWHLQFIAQILRADDVDWDVLGALVFAVHGLVAGLLAVRAGRRLLDPAVDSRRARKAVLIYLVVDVGGDLVRFVMSVALPLHGDVPTVVVMSITIHFVLGLITPGLLWWYLHGAFADAKTNPVAVPPRSQLATLPAWAVLWFVPILLSRPLVMHVLDTPDVSATVLRWVVIACVIQGITHLVAGVGALVARTTDADGARRIARIASSVAMVNAFAMVVSWGVVVFSAQSFVYGHVPLDPLVQIFAATTTLWWMLRRT